MTTNRQRNVQVGDILQAESWEPVNSKSNPQDVNFNATAAHTISSGQYVVEEAIMAGGGTGHGPHDVYPDGWQVTARKLNPDLTYNPKGKQVRFYQSGCFNCMVPRPRVVGKMERKVTFTKVAR